VLIQNALEKGAIHGLACAIDHLPREPPQTRNIASIAPFLKWEEQKILSVSERDAIEIFRHRRGESPLVAQCSQNGAAFSGLRPCQLNVAKNVKGSISVSAKRFPSAF